MRRALLFCGGVLFGLVAEAILWAGPAVYAQVSETWFATEAATIVARGAVLGLIVQGAVAAAVAAFWLARFFCASSPPPARPGTTRARAAPAAVWRGPFLPIWGILLLLGAVGAGRHVLHELETLHDWDVWANGLALEGHSDDLTRLAGYVILGGTLVAMIGSIVAVVGKSSAVGGQQ